jgi:hypothetical protein
VQSLIAPSGKGGTSSGAQKTIRRIASRAERDHSDVFWNLPCLCFRAQRFVTRDSMATLATSRVLVQPSTIGDRNSVRANQTLTTSRSFAIRASFDVSALPSIVEKTCTHAASTAFARTEYGCVDASYRGRFDFRRRAQGVRAVDERRQQSLDHQLEIQHGKGWWARGRLNKAKTISLVVATSTTTFFVWRPDLWN